MIVFRMTVTNRQLLRWLQASEDRAAIAAIMVELAERAERNPMLQEMLKHIKMRPPFDVFEYVKPSNRRGYWARKPYWREHPTIPQLKAKLKFSEIAYSLFGERGLVERADGTRIPVNSHLVGELMRGKKFVSEEELDTRRWQKAVEKIAMV